MFVWALGVVGYTGEVGLGKVFQDAEDQRGALPLFCLFTCFVCFICAVLRVVVLLESISSPAKQKRVVLQSFESLNNN